MEDVAERSFARLAEWRQARYHAECSAVAALHHVTAAAAAGAHPLPHTLQLEVSDRRPSLQQHHECSSSVPLSVPAGFRAPFDIAVG